MEKKKNQVRIRDGFRHQPGGKAGPQFFLRRSAKWKWQHKLPALRAARRSQAGLLLLNC